MNPMVTNQYRIGLVVYGLQPKVDALMHSWSAPNRDLWSTYWQTNWQSNWQGGNFRSLPA